MFETSVLMWGLVFGSVGLGQCVYGRKKGALIPMICGVVLMVIPYTVTNVFGLVLLGTVLTVAPFVIKL